MTLEKNELMASRNLTSKERKYAGEGEEWGCDARNDKEVLFDPQQKSQSERRSG